MNLFVLMSESELRSLPGLGREDADVVAVDSDSCMVTPRTLEAMNALAFVVDRFKGRMTQAKVLNGGAAGWNFGVTNATVEFRRPLGAVGLTLAVDLGLVAPNPMSNGTLNGNVYIAPVAGDTPQKVTNNSFSVGVGALGVNTIALFGSACRSNSALTTSPSPVYPGSPGELVRLVLNNTTLAANRTLRFLAMWE